MKDVKIADRQQEIEYLRMACNMAELPISYTQADLIISLQEKLNQAQGNFTLKDGVTIHHNWKERWQEYFEKQNNTP